MDAREWLEKNIEDFDQCNPHWAGELESMLNRYTAPLRDAYNNQVQHTDTVRSEYQKMLAKADEQIKELEAENTRLKVDVRVVEVNRDGWRAAANTLLDERKIHTDDFI